MRVRDLPDSELPVLPNPTSFCWYHAIPWDAHSPRQLVECRDNGDPTKT